jgi:hypothetical protein
VPQPEDESEEVEQAQSLSRKASGAAAAAAAAAMAAASAGRRAGVASSFMCVDADPQVGLHGCVCCVFWGGGDCIACCHVVPIVLSFDAFCLPLTPWACYCMR